MIKSAKGSHHNPGHPDETNKGITENALKRAIYYAKTTLLPTGKVTWIDFEPPVGDSGNPRDNCMDLLGIDDKGRYVICELKFLRTSIKDTAKDAAEQALDYHKMLCDNRLTFKLHENAAIREIDLDALCSKDTRIIVAANARCWSRWTRSRKWDPSALPTDVEYYSIDVAPDEFPRQQGTAKKAYVPKLPASGRKWTRIA